MARKQKSIKVIKRSSSVTLSVAIPKDLVDFLKIKQGDKVRFEIKNLDSLILKVIRLK